MRDGLAVSIFGHAALLVWGVFNLSAPKPIDASSIEAIPVDFVQIEDVTSVPKGVAVAKAVEEPPPEPVKQQAEEPPPLPKPDPVPPPEPTPPPPDPTPIPPQPPEPEPLPPEPEPLPPEDTPPPEPEPPAPAPEPQPEAPPPEPEPPPPPPPEQPPAIQPKPANVPLPKARPHFTPPPQVAQKPKDKFDPDQIAALLDKDQTPPAAEQPEPALGGTSGTNDPQMTANELDALRARLGKCWSPPIGWTRPGGGARRCRALAQPGRHGERRSAGAGGSAGALRAGRAGERLARRSQVCPLHPAAGEIRILEAGESDFRSDGHGRRLRLWKR